jgi:serine/threonine-protein kinase
LGRWHVGKRIAGGGMADVYLGSGTGDDGNVQHVALKVMRAEHRRDPRFLRMFSDEAKILSRLSHPNVVRTIDYGITPEHRFIAMELLVGHPLAEVWQALLERKQTLPLRLGAWVCARAAEGLHAAHELTGARGEPLHLVHRDVNATNIVVTYRGEVKLVDFGLAKARERRERTVEGVLKGKLAYLAPELFGADPLAIDRRADVYSLGITLWELGTMSRLFKRTDDVETLRAAQAAAIPDPRVLVEGYPDALFDVVSRALQRDREARYQTAADMQRDLDGFVGDDAAGAMSAELASLLAWLYPRDDEAPPIVLSDDDLET